MDFCDAHFIVCFEMGMCFENSRTYLNTSHLPLKGLCVLPCQKKKTQPSYLEELKPFDKDNICG